MEPTIDSLFLTTRETFPGEKSFSELSRQFFGEGDRSARSRTIEDRWTGSGLLVHMANPEQIDDLFAHIDREKKVRYLSTSYLHSEVRPTVYAIGRGTGILVDDSLVRVDHVSVTDSATVTAPGKKLVVSDHAKLPGIKDLHAALKETPSNEWNEVNVSFEGSEPITGFFSLDGVMSKLYATALFLKAKKLLPVFTYNREHNRLAEFSPTHEDVSELIDQVPVPFLRDRYRQLLDALE